MDWSKEGHFSQGTVSGCSIENKQAFKNVKVCRKEMEKKSLLKGCIL